MWQNSLTNSIPVPRNEGGFMNGIRTDYREMKDGRVNEWESILGRLDAVGDEINRALNWTTSSEEPGSGTGLPPL
jgi:hypothetical protein